MRVVPRASRSRVEAGPPVKVYVTSPPIDNEANSEVVQILAKALGVPKGRVTIVRGHRSRDKTLEIEGLEASEISGRLV